MGGSSLLADMVFGREHRSIYPFFSRHAARLVARPCSLCVANISAAQIRAHPSAPGTPVLPGEQTGLSLLQFYIRNKPKAALGTPGGSQESKPARHLYSLILETS